MTREDIKDGLIEYVIPIVLLPLNVVVLLLFYLPFNYLEKRRKRNV